jgi:hypothetical protein
MVTTFRIKNRRKKKGTATPENQKQNVLHHTRYYTLTQTIKDLTWAGNQAYIDTHTPHARYSIIKKNLDT